MAKISRSKDIIHFSGRRHTRLGISSAIIGILVFIGFIAISIFSAFYKGNGSFIVGMIGFLLFGLAIFGFIISYKAFKERDIFFRFPIIGAALNGLMIIILLILYIMGLV